MVLFLLNKWAFNLEWFDKQFSYQNIPSYISKIPNCFTLLQISSNAKKLKRRGECQNWKTPDIHIDKHLYFLEYYLILQKKFYRFSSSFFPPSAFMADCHMMLLLHMSSLLQLPLLLLSLTIISHVIYVKAFWLNIFPDLFSDFLDTYPRILVRFENSTQIWVYFENSPQIWVYAYLYLKSHK